MNSDCQLCFCWGFVAGFRWIPCRFRLDHPSSWNIHLLYHDRQVKLNTVFAGATSWGLSVAAWCWLDWEGCCPFRLLVTSEHRRTVNNLCIFFIAVDPQLSTALHSSSRKTICCFHWEFWVYCSTYACEQISHFSMWSVQSVVAFFIIFSISILKEGIWKMPGNFDFFSICLRIASSHSKSIDWTGGHDFWLTEIEQMNWDIRRKPDFNL